MKKIIAALFLLLPLSASATTIGSCAVSSSAVQCGEYLGQSCGQSFKTNNDGTTYQLTGVTVSMAKIAGTTGNVYIEVFNVSGVFGTSNIPTEPALVVSDAIAAASVSGTQGNVTFNFSTTSLQLSPNTDYGWAIVDNTDDSSHGYNAYGTSGSGADCAGNVYYEDAPYPAWNPVATIDLTPFTITGTAVGGGGGAAPLTTWYASFWWI